MYIKVGGRNRSCADSVFMIAFQSENEQPSAGADLARKTRETSKGIHSATINN